MSSLSDVQHLRGRYAEQATSEGIIAAYLDRLCDALIGIIPIRERVRLREEAEFHLECLLNAYMLEGMVPTQAAQHAVEKYGSASAVAQQFLDAWYAHHPQGRLVRRIGLGIVTAFLWFGTATLLVTLLLQYRVYRPEMSPLQPGGRLPMIRQILPAPLPAVEINAPFLALWGLAFVAPLVAGWMTGIKVLVRPMRSVCQVQAVLTLYTFTLGIQLLPASEGMSLALFQLLYWLPAGCLTAQMAAHVTIRRRCRKLLGAEVREEE